jgi:hypothetical protein
MHLLNTRTRKLEYFVGTQMPNYAILSHTWGSDEVSMHDLIHDSAANLKKGYVKINHMCEQALIDGLEYAWVDTCCIDKTSSAELSEAINSMYNWYARAVICYVYVSDVGFDDMATSRKPRVIGEIKDGEASVCTEIDIKLSTAQQVMFSQSRWFTRGWTLQELIAPPSLVFFDRNWTCLGRRSGRLLWVIAKKTGIHVRVLKDGRWMDDWWFHLQSRRECLSHFTIAQKMSWASHRTTTRMEDEAYCLLGLFDINMPLLYGEEERAFYRLQKEILSSSNDQSLLAWEYPATLRRPYQLSVPSRSQRIEAPDGPLAPSARYFRGCGEIFFGEALNSLSTTSILTNGGLRISAPLVHLKLSVEDAKLVPWRLWASQQCFGIVLNCLRGSCPVVLPVVRDGETTTPVAQGYYNELPRVITKWFKIATLPSLQQDLVFAPTKEGHLERRRRDSLRLQRTGSPQISVRLSGDNHFTETRVAQAAPQNQWDFPQWPLKAGNTVFEANLGPMEKVSSIPTAIAFTNESHTWMVQICDVHSEQPTLVVGLANCRGYVDRKGSRVSWVWADILEQMKDPFYGLADSPSDTVEHARSLGLHKTLKLDPLHELDVWIKFGGHATHGGHAIHGGHIVISVTPRVNRNGRAVAAFSTLLR